MVGVLFLKCIIICCPFQELEMKVAFNRNNVMKLS